MSVLGDHLQTSAKSSGDKLIGGFADTAQDIMTKVFGGLIGDIALRNSTPVLKAGAIGVGTLAAIGVVAYLVFRKGK